MSENMDSNLLSDQAMDLVEMYRSAITIPSSTPDILTANAEMGNLTQREEAQRALGESLLRRSDTRGQILTVPIGQTGNLDWVSGDRNPIGFWGQLSTNGEVPISTTPPLHLAEPPIPVELSRAYPGPISVNGIPPVDNSARRQVANALSILQQYLPVIGSQSQYIDLSSIVQPLWDEILRLKVRLEEVNRMYEEVLFQVETGQLATKTEKVA